MTCVWDVANKSTSITLYRMATVAASIVSNGTWKAVRGTVSQSTGKKYLEIVQGFFTNSGIIFGFGNASLNTASYVGSDANSFGYQSNITSVYGIPGSWQGTSKMGEVVQIAIDLDAKLVWARTDRSTNWNNSGSADPATGVGGKAYTTTGALFPAVSLLGANSVGVLNWVTINAGGFTFSGTIPSGFSAWDTGTPTGTGIGGTFGPTTWNTGTKNANITVTGPNLQASNSTNNNLWCTVYGTSNYNNGQVYFEMTLLALDPNSGILFGLSDTTAGTANNIYTGSSPFSIGYQLTTNVILANTIQPGFTWQGAVISNILGCAVDFNRGLMWVKNLNAAPGYWNGDAVGDPVAGTRGAAIPPGDLYIAFSGLSNNGADTMVLNTGVSPFFGTAPSGYSAWDSTGGTGATAQIDTLSRGVLLADTGTVAVDSIAREVLLTETGVLQVSGTLMEVLLNNPSALQVGGAFGEVLRSTTIWTPVAYAQRNRTYRIR